MGSRGGSVKNIDTDFIDLLIKAGVKTRKAVVLTDIFFRRAVTRRLSVGILPGICVLFPGAWSGFPEVPEAGQSPGSFQRQPDVPRGRSLEAPT